jgi:hypothetical protein
MIDPVFAYRTGNRQGISQPETLAEAFVTMGGRF